MKEEIKQMIKGSVVQNRAPFISDRLAEVNSDIWDLESLLVVYPVTKATHIMRGIQYVIQTKLHELKERREDLLALEDVENSSKLCLDQSVSNLVDAFDTYTKPLDQMPMLLNSEDGLLKLIAKSRLEDGK